MGVMKELSVKYPVTIPKWVAEENLAEERAMVFVTLDEWIVPQLESAKAAHAKGKADVVEYMLNDALEKINKLSRELQEANAKQTKVTDQ